MPLSKTKFYLFREDTRTDAASLMTLMKMQTTDIAPSEHISRCILRYSLAEGKLVVGA